MIVSCPSCSTRFFVDPSVLGTAGRRVRCARCGHVWHQAPETDAEPAPGAGTVEAGPAERLEPTPLPYDPDVAAAGPAQHRRPAWGWLLFGAVVVLLAGGVLLGQERIVGAWPAAERLYRAVGMSAPAVGEGLAIRDVSPETRLENGERAVLVTGRIVNTSTSAVDLPAVMVALVDDRGAVLSELRAPFGRSRLEAGSDSGFAVEFTDPAPNAAGVTAALEGAAGN